MKCKNRYKRKKEAGTKRWRKEERRKENNNGNYQNSQLRFIRIGSTVCHT